MPSICDEAKHEGSRYASIAYWYFIFEEQQIIFLQTISKQNNYEQERIIEKGV